MDLNVRDWLIIIGTLLATAVLLDGYRRVRKDRRETLRLSAKARYEDDDLSNPELPTGTARVVAVRETPSLHMKRVQTPAPRPRQEPEVAAPETDDYDAEAYVGNYDDADDDILFTDPADEYSSHSKTQIVEDDDEDEVVAGWSSASNDDEDEVSIRVAPDEVPEHVSAAAVEKAPAKKQEKPQSQPEHQELLVINAMAPEGKPFKGNDLLQILMACDVRYGKMNIFHRYENSDGTGEIQFSVANLVEPGNFDLDEIDEFTTPGVVFFMHLPGPKESIKAYEAMVETARCLVKNLEGELRDQTHSVATKQTLEHYKQRIRDFERRQLTLM